MERPQLERPRPDRPAALRDRVRQLGDVRATLRERVQAARQGGDDHDVIFVHDVRDDQEPRADAVVAAPVRAAAEWSWRILVIGALIVVVAMVLWDLLIIVVPIVAALLLSALLQPAVRLLRKIGMSPVLAAAIVLVGGIAIIVLIATALVNVLTSQFGEISTQVQSGVTEIKSWASDGPLQLSDADINAYVQQATDYVSSNQSALAGGLIASATAAIEILSATLLTLFITFFFLYDGTQIWAWIAKLFPRQAERPVLEAGNRVWVVLVSYVRATIFIAATDALLIGILLAILGVPLAVPLGALVFFGAFIPIVGATVSGIVAILVTLVAVGPVQALIVLGGVIVIQQLEGHVLQPLIMGRFIKIHPLAVVLSVATGALVAGIVGTVVAVPLAAVLKTVLSYFAALQRGPMIEPPRAGTVEVPHLDDKPTDIGSDAVIDELPAPIEDEPQSAPQTQAPSGTTVAHS